ncbi:ferredoxin [Desulfopila aestuarii]|uniref:Ferredoxin n=1 Tax=Desulfopila aestuarii DSM 18488 TaxID=1121416 RepID=A0A1M7YEB8_9BACT|nr:ferredoxin [Desulfopila aestuarii]SHO50838.1 ferredoxin [Desulfopila aestuarii DSM 18488]
MATEVQLDQDECIGCEACVEICPSVFAFDDDEGKAHVIDGADAEEDCVDEAIASCPSACITKE